MLELSTAHVRPETMARLENDDFEWLPVYKKSFGEEVFGAFAMITDLDDEEAADIPDDLMKVIRYAIRKGCDWVMFDRDYDEIAELPTYREDWDKRMW